MQYLKVKSRRKVNDILWLRRQLINRDADGNESAFHGVYHEILAPERIIDTFEFEGLPEAGHVERE